MIRTLDPRADLLGKSAMNFAELKYLRMPPHMRRVSFEKT
jgi:hypothetical protein